MSPKVKKKTRGGSGPPGDDDDGDGGDDDGDWWYEEDDEGWGEDEWFPGEEGGEEEEPVESSDESEEESESVARSSELDPNDSIARALLKLAKKPTLNPHFREPDKLTFRAQPDAPNLRLWWINTRGVVQNASSNPKIREWILECSTAPKRSSLKRVGTFQTIDNKIRTAMQAIVKPELASKFLDAHERCEKEDPGRDLTGREMIWMLFDYLKQASNRHSYTDYEDLASVKLHGKRLGKFWESWKVVLRSITKKLSLIHI